MAELFGGRSLSQLREIWRFRVGTDSAAVDAGRDRLALAKSAATLAILTRTQFESQKGLLLGRFSIVCDGVFIFMEILIIEFDGFCKSLLQTKAAPIASKICSKFQVLISHLSEVDDLLDEY